MLDGGIFAGVWSSGGTNMSSPETFFSTLIFLEVGKKHILKFYMANAGYLYVGPLLIHCLLYRIFHF